MWSNRAEGTYCVEEKHTAGEYVTQNGVTYFGYPGIQIFLEKIDFEVFDDNEYRVAYMAVCLLHELGHYYGLSEKYNLTSHDDQTNLTCVMKRIGAMYGSANSVVSSLSTVEKLQNVKLFYEEIMNSTENLFCTECKDTVKANCHTYKYIGGLRDEE